jgi:predicted dehydrogenase
MTVTIGVAPTGVGARLHIPGLRQRPDVAIRPVRLPHVDIPVAPLRWDTQTALDGLDLFILATPPYCHVRHADLLLRVGVPVICEKPAGLNAAEARQIADCAEQSGAECRVNFQLRFHPLVRRARTLAAAEPPREIAITCSSSARSSRSGRPAWYWQREAGGGVWFSLLPHLVDLAYHLGVQPLEVTVTRALPTAGPDRGIDAITVHALCQDERRLTLTADPLADATRLAISFRDTPGRELAVFDLTADGANPWLTAFSACADAIVLGGYSVDLNGCATLQDAARAHEVIRAVRVSITSGVGVPVS